MRVVWIGVVIAALIIAAQSPVAAQSAGTSEKKLESRAKTAVTGQVAAEAYACPMHPAVVSARAGKCPTCGMALEKKPLKPSAVRRQPQARKGGVHKEKCGGCQDPCSGCAESCDKR